MATSWYSFTITSGADPLDPNNYSSISPKPSCPGTSKICAIFATDDGFGRPVISQAIEDEMVQNLQLGQDGTLVLLRTT